MIIEHKPPPDSVDRFGDVAVVAQVHFFVLQGPPEPFDEDVVVGPLPHLSMEIRIFLARRTEVNFSLV